MSEHRKWSADTWLMMSYNDLMTEHNALHTAWQDSQAELERIGKINNSMCDTIAELEKPIRVPFSDAQIDVMAKAAFTTWMGYDGELMVQSAPVVNRWHSIIRAALAAGGLEPCAVPERASDEELAEIAYAAENKAILSGDITTIQVCQEVAAAVRARVEAPLLAEIQRLNSEATNWAMRAHSVEAITAERDALCAEVQRLEVECRDRAFYVEQFAAVSQERDAARAELDAVSQDRDVFESAATKALTDRDALRQRDTVPVKVRWDVTAGDVEAVFADGGTVEDSWQAVMDYLAAHAVIDVPAGVPSVEELAEMIYSHVRTGRNYATSEDELKAAATAIRDAVLAGVVAPAPTDEQVEALARVLDEAFEQSVGGKMTTWGEQNEVVRSARSAQARAAFAHFGTVHTWTGPTRAEAEAKWEECYEAGIGAYLDWLLPRLPETAATLECKECAGWKAKYLEASKHADDMHARNKAVRAALEGE